MKPSGSDTGSRHRTTLKRLRSWGGAVTVGLLAAAVLLPGSALAQGASNKTLVVAANFVVESLDPGRTIETTSNMINHAVYDSLTTFQGANLKTPLPSLATSWDVSSDGTSYTFHLRSNVQFVNGDPLTSADVKWSFERVINLKSNPAFFLAQVASIDTPDAQTVVIHLTQPFPALPAILSSPSLGVMDASAAQAQGASAAADAAKTDTAEQYLNSHSLGTGPYSLTSYTPDQSIVLTRNPHYWGAPAYFSRIVIEDITQAASQQLQLAKGTVQIATGLSPTQVPSLNSNSNVTVSFSPAATTYYLLMNNNPSVGGAFSNPMVQQAVRYALDYKGILSLVGKGATPLAGIIPGNFAGSLPPSDVFQTDVAKAKSLLAQANVGPVTGKLSYASDSVIWGVPDQVLAQKVQSDLAAVGMNVSLDGLPEATALQKYRDGKDQLGLWSWAADYPSPIDFLVYLPGGVVGKRAGWPADASPQAQALAQLGQQAMSETDDTMRATMLQQIDTKLANTGPYAPLFQPSALVAYRSNLTGVTYNTVWGVDFYTVKETP